MNHSCDPNAFVFFEGNELRVRALKANKADEEITQCYGDVTAGVITRRGMIKRTFSSYAVVRLRSRNWWL